MKIHSVPLSKDTEAESDQSEYSDFPSFKIEKIIKIELTNVAFELEKHIGGYLVDPIKGIYVPGKLHPAVSANSSCYTKNNQGDMEVVLDITGVTSDVYSENGNLVIPRRYLQPSNIRISNKPHVPVIPLRIIETLLLAQVNEAASWYTDTTDPDGKIIRMFLDYDKLMVGFPLSNYTGSSRDKQKKQRLEVDGLITDILAQCHRTTEDLSKELWTFIGTDCWHMHFLKLENTMITVEKGEDYRIHQWNHEHGHKYNKR